jgi:hypothetical protein
MILPILPIADGTINLNTKMCLKAHETLRSLERAAELEPTNDLSAYDMNTDALYLDSRELGFQLRNLGPG